MLRPCIVKVSPILGYFPLAQVSNLYISYRSRSVIFMLINNCICLVNISIYVICDDNVFNLSSLINLFQSMLLFIIRFI